MDDGRTDEMVGLSKAKAEFNRVTTRINETGRPVTILKHNMPWVRILPLADDEAGHANATDGAASE